MFVVPKSNNSLHEKKTFSSTLTIFFSSVGNILEIVMSLSLLSSILKFNNVHCLSREVFALSSVSRFKSQCNKSYPHAHFHSRNQQKQTPSPALSSSLTINSKSSAKAKLNQSQSAFLSKSASDQIQFRNQNQNSTTRTVIKMAQVPKNILITGGNSGLGLEMVKQLLKLEPKIIFATYRNLDRSKELEELSKADPRVRLIQLDMRQDCIYCKALKEVFDATKDEGINLLINNAGIFTERQTLCEVDKKTFLDFLEVNTVAPVLLVKELLPLLVKASEVNGDKPMGIGRAAVVNITSSYGSIGSNDEGNYYLSRCCRAALNAASKNLSVDLKPKKILVTAMSPGWVRTEQGGPNAPLSVEESISGIIKVLQNLDDSKTGTFFDYAGKEIPW